jgi:two-component system chemotaxis response regulator CheY
MSTLRTNVLVVDDYPAMRSIVRGLPQEVGIINIAEAGDGGTALGKLRGDGFGLIISDWNMEPMSGLQLLKEVRADQRLAKLPFIMMTGETKADYVVAAKEAGVSSYIVKPFNVATLKQKIEAVIGALRERP